MLFRCLRCEKPIRSRIGRPALSLSRLYASRHCDTWPCFWRQDCRVRCASRLFYERLDQIWATREDKQRFVSLFKKQRDLHSVHSTVFSSMHRLGTKPNFHQRVRCMILTFGHSYICPSAFDYGCTYLLRRAVSQNLFHYKGAGRQGQAHSTAFRPLYRGAILTLHTFKPLVTFFCAQALAQK